jgi:hypothetical protein
MARLQWLTHKGKQVLLLDFSQYSAKRVEELAREVQQIITAQRPQSVLVLADFSGAAFSPEALRTITKAAAVNRRYVLRTAWVGTEKLSEAQFRAIQEFSGRDIRRFQTREEALNFLVGDRRDFSVPTPPFLKQRGHPLYSPSFFLPHFQSTAQHSSVQSRLRHFQCGITVALARSIRP